MSNQKKRIGNFCGRTRREFLWQTGGGFAGAALASMLSQDGFLQAQESKADGTPWENPLKAREPHFPAKAKNENTHPALH